MNKSNGKNNLKFSAVFHWICYVIWNLFTVGSLQFPNDSTIASLEVTDLSLYQTVVISQVRKQNDGVFN